MPPDKHRKPTTKKEPANNFVLLRHEIDRAKKRLETQGDSGVVRQRLQRLEALLETCLEQPDDA